MATFDIIVPHYGANKKLNDTCIACLQSVRVYSKDYRLLLVDNGSTDTDDLILEVGRHDDAEILRAETNLGFVKAANMGLAASTAPYVVLLNNDTTVVSNWLSILQAGLLDHPHAGLCGPLSDAPGSWQGVYTPTNRAQHYKVLNAGAMLAFFCTMFTRKVLTTVGFLNEEYGVGLGDDDDYCRRAQNAGFELVLAQRLRIHHAHRTTFKALYTPEQLAILQHDALFKYHAEGGQFVRRVAEYGHDGALLVCGHSFASTTAHEVVCPACILDYMARRR